MWNMRCALALGVHQGAASAPVHLPPNSRSISGAGSSDFQLPRGAVDQIHRRRPSRLDICRGPFVPVLVCNVVGVCTLLKSGGLPEHLNSFWRLTPSVSS